MKKRVSLASIFALIALLSTSGVAVSEGTGVDFSSWNSFENNLNQCADVSNDRCITDDSLANVDGDFIRAQVWSGNNGFCGTGGLERTVTLPDREDLGVAISLQRARLDYWGGSVGLKIEPETGQSEWVIQITSDGGEKKFVNNTAVNWFDEESLYYSDISEYAGQEVTLKLVTEDLSEKWCNMPDHEQKMEANFLFIASPIQYEDFDENPNVEGVFGWSSDAWSDYSSNLAQCGEGTSYNCDPDDQLATDKIEDSKLKLSTPETSGTCGTHGRRQFIWVPKADEVTLHMESSAELDSYAGRVGVMFNDEWALDLDNGNEGTGDNYGSPATHDMEERTADVSDYAGQWVSMKVVLRDESGKHCTNADHSASMTVDRVWMTASGDEGQASNQAPDANFSYQIFSGRTVTMDASETTDPDNPVSDYEVRWDFQNDGSWDTDWKADRTEEKTYSESTTETTVKVQVRDGDGGSDTATRTITFESDSDEGGDNGGDSGDGSPSEVSFEGEGWKALSLSSSISAGDIPSECGGTPTAYSSTSDGSIAFHSLAGDSGPSLEAGSYLFKMDSSCSTELPTGGAATTGQTSFEGDGWGMVNLAEPLSKDTVTNECGETPTAYGSASNGEIVFESTAGDSGELDAKPWLMKMDSSCTITLPGSTEDEDSGDGDSGDDGNDGDGSDASEAQQWCSSNNHGDAAMDSCGTSSQAVAEGGLLYSDVPGCPAEEKGWVCTK